LLIEGFEKASQTGTTSSTSVEQAALIVCATGLPVLPDRRLGKTVDLCLHVTYGVMGLAFAILLFGGTVERMLEYASWAMVTYIFAFLVFVNIAFVPWLHTAETLTGFVEFGTIPANMDWQLLASLAATAGSGGIGNLTISNWIRDKGWGMGGCVGAIPSAFGGKKIELSHTGKVFPVTASNLQRWRTWWTYVAVDQVWLWGFGCFLGMFLNVNLASAIIPAEVDLRGPAAGAFQAEYMAKHLWTGLWYLGLLNGFWILFSTHLGNTDILVRTITDVLWVASSRVRSTPRLHVGRIYFGLLCVFSLWGAVIVNFGTAMTQFQVLAAIAGLVLVPASLQILRINTTLLPPELRPSWWRRVALVLCAGFYALVCLLVLISRLPLLAK
jgi:hypothetical protein